MTVPSGRWPWWLQVLVVYAAARAVSALVLLAVARTQAASGWTGAAPSYPEFTGSMWDADWYRSIAAEGYPQGLPRDVDGRVPQNAWAFFPLFPLLVRAVMAVTGGAWHVVAPTTALVLGAGAVLVVHQVVVAGLDRSGRAAELSDVVRRSLPLATVAVLSTAPASPVLQVGYTESLALLLVAGVLWCLLRSRYALAVPLVVLLGLTRAVALPVALVVVVHAVSRWRSDRAGEVPFPRSERLQLAVLGAVSVAAGLLWPVLTGVLTGQPDAYTQTQGAWRARGEVVPLLPWLDVARWLLGPWGPVALLVLLVLAVAVVASPAMARTGPELRAWTAGYLGYLVVVIEPGTSLVRFLLLAFPLAAWAAQLALRARWPWAALLTVMALGAGGQVAWVGLLWRLVPPSGWPP